MLNEGLIEALIGRQAYSTLRELHAAIGGALSLEQQVFVSSNWRGLSRWLQTKEGREHARLLVDGWKDSETSVKPPEP